MGGRIWRGERARPGEHVPLHRPVRRRPAGPRRRSPGWPGSRRPWWSRTTTHVPAHPGGDARRVGDAADPGRGPGRRRGLRRPGGRRPGAVRPGPARRDDARTWTGSAWPSGSRAAERFRGAGHAAVVRQAAATDAASAGAGRPGHGPAGQAVLPSPTCSTPWRPPCTCPGSGSIPPPSRDRSTAARPRPLHVLLAEDNAVNQLVATEYLELAGHTAVRGPRRGRAVTAFADGRSTWC